MTGKILLAFVLVAGCTGATPDRPDATVEKDPDGGTSTSGSRSSFVVAAGETREFDVALDDLAAVGWSIDYEAIGAGELVVDGPGGDCDVRLPLATGGGSGSAADNCGRLAPGTHVLHISSTEGVVRGWLTIDVAS